MQKEKRIPDDVREILAQYPFRDPEIRFLRRNENEVFAVRDGAERFVLRIQRPAEGFSLRPLYGETSPAVYLDGELDLLEFLRECAEFPVQQPVRNRMEPGNLTRSGISALPRRLRTRTGFELSLRTHESAYR